jgi:phage/plasmid-associated DNA primase
LSTHYTQNPKLEYKFDIPLNKTNKKSLVSIKQTSESEEEPQTEKINYFLDNGFLQLIKTKKDHSNFTKFGYAIYNTWGEEGLNLYLKMAESHSDNYDASVYTDRYKDVISKVKSNISVSTVFYIFQEYDAALYTKLMANFRKLKLKTDTACINDYLEITIYSQTEFDFAKVLYEMYKDTYKCVDKEKKRWYYFNGVVWIEDKGITIRTKISVEMFTKYEFIQSNIMDQMNGLDQTGDIYESLKKKSKLISEIQKKIKGTTVKNNIIKEAMDLFYDAKFYDKLDNKPYLFAFNNCVFDLKTGLKINPNKDDYLSITCGYDYNDNYDPNLIVELNKIIYTILFDKELKDYYMSVLATGLCGVTLQKFHIATGTGGNGKSILNSLALDCVGKYGYKLKPAILQEDIKTGANPEVANLHKKRLVISQEPDKNKKLKSSTIKEITGDKDLNARGLYSGDTVTKLSITLIMECNEMPIIDETGGGIGRRLNTIPFELKALEAKDYDNLTETDKNSGKYALQNTEYITDEFRTKYKQALFMILLGSFKKFVEDNYNILSAPKICLTKTKDYMATSDDIFCWFESYYEPLSTEELKTDTDIPISLTKIHGLFTSSEVFRNMSKEQRRSYNRKNFLEKIENNLFLRKHVIYRDTSYNGTQLKTNSIIGWKTIKTEE